MVIACPHALGLAVPLVVAVSTALAARSGLLIRDRAAFERGRELGAVVFDKTGTLTEGRFGVTDVVPLADADDREVLRLAAGLESQSEHPIARGIVQRAKELSLPIERLTEFRNVTGQGALARIGEDEIAVVGPGYLAQNGVRIDNPALSKLTSQSKTRGLSPPQQPAPRRNRASRHRAAGIARSTSAPWSPRSIVAHGPDSMLVRSMMR